METDEEPDRSLPGQDAVLAIGSGEWTRAEVLAERARSVVRRARLEEYVTSALLYAVAARTAFDRYELDRARQDLARVQRLRPQIAYALPLYEAQTRLELVRAHIALTDVPAARSLLAEVDALLAARPDGDVTWRIIGEQAVELRAQLDAMDIA
jgi:LuxR family transcriptional regulator, maltose regulon positive regulatory protein